MLGTLPDLDVFIDFGDAVRNFTYHRGFSHSLFVLPGVAVLIWLALRRWWAPVRAAPAHWLAAVVLALATHPLLDAHTAYGTQLLWPLAVTPTSWATLFIIDPLYTLPLLAGVIAIGGWASRPGAHRALVAYLVLSSAYVVWSWAGKSLVEREARASLAASGIEYSAMFSTPTPLNTLLWRVVVMTEQGYAEGLDSLLIDEGPMTFVSYPSDTEALAAATNVWAVRQLRWFADGFVKADVVDGRLIMTDLRMGHAPEYVFRHVVAEGGNPHWQSVKPERAMTMFDRQDLSAVFRRILGDNGDKGQR